jgi:indolepyruvate ferredoxin oxidoreductase
MDIVECLVTGLTRDNHRLAVEIAGLPELIRGYEDIKLAAVEVYRERLGELLARFGTEPAGVR